MSLLPLVLIAQLALPARHVLPVLAFPERGLDDTAAYRGYRTRLFRDAARNTVQVYLDAAHGRVVHLWADAENESVGFTARDAAGRPAALRWGGDGADVGRAGQTRSVAYRLLADGPRLVLGGFLLGSMRVERDFQYAGRQSAPFAEPAFRVREVERLVDAVERLAPDEQRRQLALLGADDIAALRSRLGPRLSTRQDGAWSTTRIVQPSLDARDTLALEIRADRRRVDATLAGDSLVLLSHAGGPLVFEARVTTTGAALTPLSREEIFTPDFLRWLRRAEAGGAAGGGDRGGPPSRAGRESRAESRELRARRLERQVRGVELLSSREKLMAGLPTYATYFGRDMMVSALMMRPIWRSTMFEAVIASVLRKLGPRGDVSHEEALGGQAIREAASDYVTLADSAAGARARGAAAAADALVERQRAVLRDLRRTRENYHMIDDEFQLPVVVARWLDDPSVSAAHRRAFLLDSADGGEPRAVRLLRELALVGRLTAPYAADPTPANLVSFAPRDSGWSSASWRDSGVGYAGGRFAMDVNAIWAPHALDAMQRILAAMRSLGLPLEALVARAESGRSAPAGGADTLSRQGSAALATYVRDAAALDRAIATWRGAERHFVVRLGPAQVRERVAARLAAMPGPERMHWERVLVETGADRDSLVFLALSLDATGRPIDVANSDPATRLFLGEREGRPTADDDATAARTLRDVRLFARAYPVGLLVAGVGPVVANDAYAAPSVWRAFERDPYHGPRVVWGREVNLFLLGVANRLAASKAGSSGAPTAASPAYREELRHAASAVRSAVQASGFHSELWSYGMEHGRLVPLRYGTGADVQLWSTTDLAVEFALSRM